MTTQPTKKRHQRAALRKEVYQAQKTNFATTLTLLGLFTLFYYILNKLEFLEDKNTLVTFIAGGLAADLASSTAPAVYEAGLFMLSKLSPIDHKQAVGENINTLKEKEALLLDAAQEPKSFKM